MARATAAALVLGFSLAAVAVAEPFKGDLAKYLDMQRAGERVPDGGSGDLPIQGICPGDSPMHEIASHRDAIKACVEKARSGNPERQGQVTMHWVIHPNGKVTDVRALDATPETRPMADCMLKEIRTWRFSARRGKSLPIDFPFKF